MILLGKLALPSLSSRLREMETTTLAVFMGIIWANTWIAASPENWKAGVDEFSNYEMCTGP